MTKLKRLLPALTIAIALVAGAQVYKWIDEDGEVHFGDNPPEEQQELEEIAIPKGPSREEIIEARERLDKTLEDRREYDAIMEKETAYKEREAAISKLKNREIFKACFEAYQQATALKIRARVFKLDSQWNRKYLEDEDRQKEIERLNHVVSTSCKTDQKSLKRRHVSALTLSKGLNIKCVSAREKLALEVDETKQREYQEYLDSNCPDVNPVGYWIVDRIPR